MAVPLVEAMALPFSDEVGFLTADGPRRWFRLGGGMALVLIVVTALGFAPRSAPRLQSETLYFLGVDFEPTELR